MTAVVLDHVTKTFGPHTAVDDLSLAVPANAIYGLIGPNGSGNTTTLRMITRILLRHAVLDLKKDGATVIFSTHDMTVAEKMCDFILMIYKGKKVLDGKLDDIQDTYGNDTLRVRLEGADPALNGLPGVVRITDFGRLQELRLDRNADPQQVLAALMTRGKVRHFELTR